MDIRFAGIDRLYGPGTAARLARAHVCVVGIGGVGSWAVEALARSGIGELTLIDGDDVCVSNINRQLPALEGTIGRAKVAVMAERVRAINPAAVVHEVTGFVTPQNCATLVGRDGLAPYDAVLDACDAIHAKLAMVAFCRRRKVPVVTCGSAGGRIDPALVTARDLSKTEHDPLLALLRQKLRDDYGWTRNPKRYFGVTAVYSMENINTPQALAAACRPLADGAVRLDCDGGLGASTQVTGTFAFVAAARVIARLLESPVKDAAAPSAAPDAAPAEVAEIRLD